MRSFFLVALLALFSTPALAGMKFPPVTNANVVKECSECHMLYPPQMLSTKAWKMMMDGLEDHFGEDASLDVEILNEISEYHMAHSADKEDQRFLKGVEDLSNPPLKITDTPRFKKRHRFLSDAVFAQKAVGSRARCDGCHKRALGFDFDDDNINMHGYFNVLGFAVKKFWE